MKLGFHADGQPEPKVNCLLRFTRTEGDRWGAMMFRSIGSTAGRPFSSGASAYETTIHTCSFLKERYKDEAIGKFFYFIGCYLEREGD